MTASLSLPGDAGSRSAIRTVTPATVAMTHRASRPTNRVKDDENSAREL